MELTKLTKDALISQISTLTTSNTELLAQNQNLANVTNNIAKDLFSIEERIATFPLKGDPKKSLLWIWNNREAIFQIIKYVIEVIKNFRSKVDELNQKAQDELAAKQG